MTRVLSILALLSATFCAAASDHVLSVRKLIQARDQLNGKQVIVEGYFDAANLILDVTSGPHGQFAIVVDLSKGERLKFSRKDALHSGYARIAGRFEDLGPSKKVGVIVDEEGGTRDVISKPAGFRGLYRSGLTHVTRIEPTSYPSTRTH